MSSSLLLLPVKSLNVVLPHSISTFLLPEEARGAAAQLLTGGAANGDLIVACVPMLDGPRHHHLSPPSTPSLPLARLFHMGCRARILHVSFLPPSIAGSPKGGYIVTCEGLARVRLSDPKPAQPGTGPAYARPEEASPGAASSTLNKPAGQGQITPRDAPPPAFYVRADPAEPPAGEGSPSDPAVEALAQQLRRSAAAVLGLPDPRPRVEPPKGVSGVGGSSPIAPAGKEGAIVPHRGPGMKSGEGTGTWDLSGGPSDLASFIRSAPPALLADVLGSILARSQNGRMALLAAADVRQRLQLVISLASSAARTLSALTRHRGPGSSPLDDPNDRPRLPRPLRGPSPPGMSLPSLLGGGGGGSGAARGAQTDPVAQLQQQIEAAGMPDEALQMCLTELERMKRLGEGNPALAAVQTWLETMAALPWNKTSDKDSHTASLSLSDARSILDEDHYGLESVKKRIVEHVAVLRVMAASAAEREAAAAAAAADTGHGHLEPGLGSEGGGGAGREGPGTGATRGPTPSGRGSPSSVLCLVGPPGVGKTSVGKSIARALGRPMQRVALGGVRDEAEIRGHRRTYVGAMAGRVVQAVRRAGCRDCVLLLDEVDKLGRDPLRGDPAAALLEVLDPAQNHAFTDAYLGVGFPLDKIVFVVTANTTSTIPSPLLDRMEVLTLPGYTLEEKASIARRHLLPRILSDHGLDHVTLEVSDTVLRSIIEGYTREAGVRGLERQIAAICRHVAVRVVEAQGGTAGAGASSEPGAPTVAAPLPPPHRAPLRIEVSPNLLEQVLGPPLYQQSDLTAEIDSPGVAAGLVWSPTGGAVQFIEAVRVSPPAPVVEPQPQPGPGSGSTAPQPLASASGQALRPSRGSLTLTGQLGEVLNESAQIALSWVRANAGVAEALIAETADLRRPGAGSGATGGTLAQGPTAAAAAAAASRAFGVAAYSWDVHLHLPSGATPKDGPSAGVTLTCALVSLFSGIPVRGDVAMTGEISLRGHVLPVGGVKEKVLAAHRAGMSTVILPERNLRDVEGDLPDTVRRELRIVPVKDVYQVLRVAFRDSRPAAPTLAGPGHLSDRDAPAPTAPLPVGAQVAPPAPWLPGGGMQSGGDRRARSNAVDASRM